MHVMNYITKYRPFALPWISPVNMCPLFPRFRAINARESVHKYPEAFPCALYEKKNAKRRLILWQTSKMQIPKSPSLGPLCCMQRIPANTYKRNCRGKRASLQARFLFKRIWSKLSDFRDWSGVQFTSAIIVERHHSSAATRRFRKSRSYATRGVVTPHGLHTNEPRRFRNFSTASLCMLRGSLFCLAKPSERAFIYTLPALKCEEPICGRESKKVETCMRRSISDETFSSNESQPGCERKKCRVLYFTL
jgi:hypothetical protein